jgi:small-conductance mechanosensitive channel
MKAWILPAMLRKARRKKSNLLFYFLEAGWRLCIPVGLLSGAWLAARWELMPETWQSGVDRFVIAGLVLATTFLIGKVISRLVGEKTESLSNTLPNASLIRNLTRWLIYLVGGMIVLQTFGINMAPMLTALGVGGLAVALALQDTLSNLFAGLQLLAAQQIKPGQFVHLESGEQGYVMDITWRNTTLRTIQNNIVVIPNARIASSIMTNYYLPNEDISVVVEVGVSYDSDLNHVERISIETAKTILRQQQGGVVDFEPYVRFRLFGDSSINFTVHLRGAEFYDQYLIKHEFIKALHQRYQAEGIEIPFPIRTLVVKNGPDLPRSTTVT